MKLFEVKISTVSADGTPEVVVTALHSASAMGLNPFEIRASLKHPIHHGPHHAGFVLIPLKSGQA